MHNRRRMVGNDTCHHCFPKLVAQLRLGSTGGSNQRTRLRLSVARRSLLY